MSLLNRPFSLEVLKLLVEEPMSVNELVESVPDLKQGSAYRYAKELTEKGAVRQRPRPGGGRTIDLVLTEYGRSLPDLGMLFQEWFGLWPYKWGDATFEGDLGQLVISSRVAGWGPQILWNLEKEPRTMGWLESRLGASREAGIWGFDSAAQIRRRVRLMEQTGQIEPVDPDAKPIEYRPTGWSYRGAGCLAYAIANELHYEPPECKPPSVRVIAFGLVQTGHVIQAAEDVSGVIQVTIPVDQLDKPIVIHYEIVGGRMKGWRWGKAKNPTATGEGPLIHWLGPMVGLSNEQAEVTGDAGFFSGVLAGVKQGLFAPNADF